MSLERIEDADDTPWWGEHVHRYEVATQYLRPGNAVLDLACGSGLGTIRLLDAGAGRVVGGDVSEEAIASCRSKYENRIAQGILEFRKLDATRLDLQTDSFDLVVSFETVEHIEDAEAAIGEFRRVLKPGSTALFSTPNRKVSSPDGIIENPFHVREYAAEEFRSMLSRQFSKVVMAGQRFRRYDSMHHPLAPGLEKVLYLRGIRKLSLKVRDALMRSVGVRRLYPEPRDYEITSDAALIEESLTLFAVCTK